MFQSIAEQGQTKLQADQIPYLLFFLVGLSLFTAFFMIKRKIAPSLQIEWTISQEKKQGERLIKRHGNTLKSLQVQLRKKKVKLLQISMNKSIYINIPKFIQKWQLSNLQELFLCQNNISSIEQLTRADLSNLRVFVLNDNFITQIRCLRRINSTNLMWVELQKNPIIESFSTLSEMDLSNVIYFWAQFFSSDPLQNNDLSSLVKLNSENLIKFHAKSSTRIRLQSVKDVLIRKYPALDLRFDEN